MKKSVPRARKMGQDLGILTSQVCMIIKGQNPQRIRARQNENHERTLRFFLLYILRRSDLRQFVTCRIHRGECTRMRGDRLLYGHARERELYKNQRRPRRSKYISFHIWKLQVSLATLRIVKNTLLVARDVLNIFCLL